MKHAILFLISLGALFAADPQARNIRTVYLLRMAGGLDQLLASELTRSGVYRVTTDPLQADAILTDALGERFQKKVAELYAPPPPPKNDSKESPDVSKVQEPARVGNNSFGGGKGAVFLVDRKSSAVVWSMNRGTAGMRSDRMARHARKIVEQLKKDVGGTPSGQ